MVVELTKIRFSLPMIFSYVSINKLISHNNFEIRNETAIMGQSDFNKFNQEMVLKPNSVSRQAKRTEQSRSLNHKVNVTL